ncbi:alpha-amylase family protein [Pontiella sulfatireligans]|uniref:Alpha-galactosidase n=1 Tax=Pontiella sulfatireligans TaxID=2750658 RepID=A0A6C2UFC0_9BACT|nr:hypothetical protein [Pontiella sulfatireligans]VGO18619.1 Alpha-galactosidase [Pontiella sulfatireligans]
MKMMFASLLSLMLACTGLAGTTVTEAGPVVTIANQKISVQFNLFEGTYQVTDLATGDIRVKNASFIYDRGFSKAEYEKRVPKTYPASYAVEQEPLADALGKGVRLKIFKTIAHDYRPIEILMIDLYDEADFIALGFGIRNRLSFPVRLKEAIVCDGVIPEKERVTSALNLNGGAGQAKTKLNKGAKISSLNMAFVTYLAGEKRRSVTAGALQTYEFMKEVRFAEAKGGLSLELLASDPHGRLIDPGTDYISRDRFYLDLSTSDGFASLEKYGQTVRAAHQAAPKVYSFPTVCGWATQNRGLGSGIPINNTAGMVEEMDIVQQSGFLNYSPVAVRVEPDYYCYGKHGNTQQGWYDDEHWAKYNTLREPYPTFGSFCAAVAERGGIPFTYFQVGMPSNDFALEHPDWMLNNDISRLHLFHGHNRPPVSYDPTDPGFKAYMLAMWQRLRAEGMKGIKFDYPETGWHPEGGFEDPYATTLSAYRSYYETCREGLGPGAYLHERLLGGKHCPLMEATLGVVDLQRVTGDGSGFDPEMVSKIGLRWYKNRVLYNYYPDSKAIAKPDRPLTQTQLRTWLSTLYMVSARLELASSFRDMSPEVLHDLERVYPVIPDNVLVRPVDLFQSLEDPNIYALDVELGWQQILVFNHDKKPKEISVPLSADPMTTGSLGLDPKKSYYVYDFWNDALVDTVSGATAFTVSLEKGQALMVSVREKVNHPQVLSTDRHILQGMLDMKDVVWDAKKKTLSATSSVVAGESYTIVVASNGAAARSVASSAKASLKKEKGLVRVVLESPENREVSWTVQF